MRIGISDLDSGWRAIRHDKWIILGSAVAAALAASATQALLTTTVDLKVPAVFFVMSVLCASACAYFRSAWRSDRLQSRQMTTTLPDAPILGRVPALPEKRISAAPGGIVQEPGYARALLEVSKKFTLDTTRSNSIIIVTSVSAGEGKTSIALNLAASLAREGRVMLVDGDLREAALSRLLSLPRYDAGLTELIARTAPFRACLAPTSIANLNVIRTGSLSGDPLEILDSTRFKRTMQLSTRHYDHIVIDSPPLEEYPDAAVLAENADVVVLVADARGGRFNRMREELDKLKRVNARCAGIVFNRVTGQ